MYTQVKLPVKINLNYLQVSQHLYIKTLSSPNKHNCLSRPVSAFAHTLMFLRGVLVYNQSPVRILHLSYSGLIRQLREPPKVLIFPVLWTCGFTCSRSRYASNRVRGVAGILFRMASRQTATIATCCSIWPHEILAFTTSTFPSFYSSYILAHFQVFTVQSHATQLTTLCALRGYISNTSTLLFSLPVIFVLDR